ncbi:MAG: hypothetical protein IT254_04380 [Chitinophagaceae bacterium]|nr:hypothetical protein [Bacteroidota bacterium]MCC6257535.1 hypothetical protein [Chitinophagaceae bacterium]MCW5915952.1 hypothetical protein [Ferruginibacter sp.]
MKVASVKELKSALQELTPIELNEIILRLARLKKENKELLSYLLFDVGDEPGYIAEIKNYLDEEFRQVNPTHPYFAKKNIRRILRRSKRLSAYSESEITHIETLLYFLEKMRSLAPNIQQSPTIQRLCFSQAVAIEKILSKMHPDLQYDYRKRLHSLPSNEADL